MCLVVLLYSVIGSRHSRHPLRVGSTESTVICSPARCVQHARRINFLSRRSLFFKTNTTSQPQRAHYKTIAVQRQESTGPDKSGRPQDGIAAVWSSRFDVDGGKPDTGASSPCIDLTCRAGSLFQTAPKTTLVGNRDTTLSLLVSAVCSTHGQRHGKVLSPVTVHRIQDSAAELPITLR